MLQSKQDSKVLILTLDRPEVKNAINDELLGLIAQSLSKAQKEESIKSVVLYGNEMFFAAGADIKELAEKDITATASDIRVEHWKTINNFSKPLIAAVNGFAFGAGCELAMACDIIIAGYNAKFAQPEIKLGIIPGAGGTQRLTLAVGKSLAMQMVLSGKPIDAHQALNANLVSELTDQNVTLNRAVKLAHSIAEHSSLALQFAKQSVNSAFESGLAASLAFERQCFIALADSDDKKLAIKNFLDKK